MRKYANDENAVEPLYAAIGKKIRRARERRGLSQEMLAASLRQPMTRACMANMEAGRQRIMLHVLIDIADACKTTLGRMMPSRERAA